MCTVCGCGDCLFGARDPVAVDGPLTGGVPEGSKWGARGLGNPGGVVTWAIEGLAADGSLSGGVSRITDAKGFDVEGTFREAFDIWSAAADIEFVQILFDPDNRPDVYIRHVEMQFAGTGAYPPVGRLRMDITNALWEFGDRNGEYAYTALHEIGHIIGLEHTLVEEAVMFGATPLPDGGLHPDDIGGARAIYGVQDFAPVTLRLDPGQDEIDLRYTAEALTVLGNGADNRIDGTAGDERLDGAAGDDTLIGGAGDDTLAGGPGADRLFGGLGLDTAVVSGAHAPGRVDATGGAVADGGAVDLLDGVDRIRFDDGVLALDLPGSELGYIARLFTAAFEREGAAGILYWQEQRFAGVSRLEIADAFTASAEFSARYGPLSDEAFVEDMFLRVLGRPGGEGGIAHWTDALAGGRSRGEVLMAFADADENRALTADTLADGLFFPDALG